MSEHVSATRRELRSFGLIAGGLFATIFGLLLPRLHHHTVPMWPWGLCAMLWIAALVAPRSLKHVFQAWSVLGQALGWINAKIILTLVFYLVMVPAGLIMRLAGRQTIARNFDPTLESYRTFSRQPSPTTMDRPY